MLLAVAMGRSGPAAAPADGAVRALDGDTLRLADGRRVRLAGVDTAETGRPTSAAATAFARAALARARRIELVPGDPPTDVYGRLLADVELDGASLSVALVEAGLAWVYESRDPELLAAQGRAVAARRGVHAHLRAPPGWPYQATAARFHHPDCPLLRDGHALPHGRADELLARGLSPCRTCLAWPPAAGAPAWSRP